MSEKEQILDEVIHDLKDGYDCITPMQSGGMGLLFKGHKKGLDIPVVIKRVKGKFQGRLNERSEADILKKLKHRYLPTIYDLIESPDGFFYTIMDYVPGYNLKEYVKEYGPVSQKWAYKWSCQLCEVVDYLHQQKPPIIHSDIKPSNVMITPDGDICLIDFNISLVFHDGLTAIGKTQGYAAPEQYTRPEYLKTPQPFVGATAATETDEDETMTMPQEESGANDNIPASSSPTLPGPEFPTSSIVPSSSSASIASSGAASSSSSAASFTDGITLRAGGFGGVTKRTDVYSLAATIYFAATGKTPPHALAESVPLSTLKHGLSPAFVSILEKAMQKHPENRFESAGSMGQALSEIHMLDARYKTSRGTAIALTALTSALIVGGVAIVGLGIQKISREQVDEYNTIITDAQNLRDAGDYEAAMNKLNEARSIYPDRLESYAEEAILLWYQEKYDECNDMVENLSVAELECNADLEWANMYCVAAQSCLELKNYDEAESWSSLALEYEPGSVYAYSYLASACYYQKDYTQEEQVLNDMLENVENADTLPEYYLMKADLMAAKGQTKEAEEQYEQILTLTDDDSILVQAYQEAVKCCTETGMDEQEIILLEKAVEDPNVREGNKSVFRIMLAEQYQALAETDSEHSDEYNQKALALYQECSKSQPGDISINLNIAEVQTNLKQYEEARNILLEIIETAPDDYRAYRDMTNLLIMQGRDNNQFDLDAINSYYEKAEELADGTYDPQMMNLKSYIVLIS